jgi:WD40 repeat protein
MRIFRLAMTRRSRFPPWLLAGFTAAVLVVCELLGISGTLTSAPFVPARDAHCVAMSPDGRLVAIGISGQSNSEFPPRPHPNPRKSGVVQVFDVSTRKRLRRMETFGDLTRVAFSHDGSLVAASRLFATDDGVELNEVRVWEVASGQTRFVFDRCHAFSFAPDRPEIVVVSRKRCVTYDLTTGSKQQSIPQLAAALTVVHSANGTRLLGVVQLADGFALRSRSFSDSSSVVESVSIPEPFYSVATPPMGSAVSTGHPDGTVLLWDPVPLRPIARLRTGGRGRAFPFFSPQGDLLAAADQANSDVVVWEASSGREIARYTFQQGALHTFAPKSSSRVIRPEEDPARFTFAPDGQSFLGGPYGGILRLVDTGRDIARFGE